MLKKIRFFSIYSKLVFTFLIVIVPMYVLSLTIINAGANSIKNEISFSIASRTQFYMDSFENEINRIDSLKKEYIFDNDLQSLSNTAPAMTDFERREAIINVQNKLLILKNSSLYVDDAKVYIPLIHRTISANQFDGDMAEEEVKALYSNMGGSPLIRWKNRLLMSEIYPFPINTNHSPMFAIELELSEEKVKRSLARITNFGGGGAVLLDQRFNWSIANQQDLPLVPMFKQFLKQHEFRDLSMGQGQMTSTGQKYFITFQRSALTNTILLVYVPEEQILGPVNSYKKRFWFLSGLSIVVVVSFSYGIYRLIHLPLHRLVRAFKKVERGDLGIAIQHSQKDEFGYMYSQFNFMVSRLKALIQEIYEQRIRLQRSELKQLQSQINPHFLYNSFFSLKRMAQMNDMEQMVSYIDSLGNYFRFITRNASDEIVLEREMNHAHAYMEIQRIRFAKRISAEIDYLPENVKTLQIPRLILQPIIENAYEHGLKDKVANGKVEVRIRIETGLLLISVEDNGESLTDETLHLLQSQIYCTENEAETTGLLNVHRRLLLKLGHRSGLEVFRGKLGGLLVIMKIPC